MVYHNDNVLVLHVLILGLTRAADVYSLDSIRVKSSSSDQQSGWPIRLICTVTVIPCFLAGIAKVVGPLDWSWVGGEALRSQMAVDGLRKELLSHGAAPLVFILYSKLWLFTVLGVGSLVLELGSPLALLNHRLARFWALNVLMMHWGIFFLMDIKFEYSLSGIIYAAFFPLERVAEWFRMRSFTSRKSATQPVLFFDGVCGLCNSTVDFILARDREGRFKFSPLQSEYAARNLDQAHDQSLSTLILKDGSEVLTRSDAVLRIASHLGGVWRLVGIFRIVPRPIRDAAYRMVASNRYRWFGKMDSCRMPTAGERTRFVHS